MVDFDAQVEGLHIEQRGRALAQRYPGRWSSSGPNGEVGQGRSDHARPRARRAVDPNIKTFVMDRRAFWLIMKQKNAKQKLQANVS